MEKQFRHNFPSCESDRSDKKERHCDVALSYTVERLEDWKRKMSSHFGWVASSMGERDNYYDDISLLNSICSRSILFRSRFNIQHRRFVETVRKECQIFIESREWEKNIQVRSGLFQNTRRGNLGSLVDITEIPSNCKLERGRSEGKQKKGRKKEKEKKRKKEQTRKKQREVSSETIIRLEDVSPRPASLHCSSDGTFRRRRTLCALEERFARR